MEMLWYISIIIGALLAYAFLLYGASFYSFSRTLSFSPIVRRWLYSLSFTVYGSGWMFFGAADNSNNQLWNSLPLFLGPALVFIFFHRVFIKILVISKQENVVSLADFIARRYGNSQLLAIVVTLLCFMAFVPYIALQLRAIISVINLLFDYQHTVSYEVKKYFIGGVLLFLAVFITIISGKQGKQVESQYKGLVLAAAISAVLKLLAFLSIGLLACYLFWQGISLGDHAFSQASIQRFFTENPLRWPDFILQTGFIMMAMICLPHLFQTGATRVQNPEDFMAVRWMLPFYLLVSAVFVLPLIVVGGLLDTRLSSHYWLVSLPLSLPSISLTFLAILGGFAATIGTMIVCCFALSRMISNHILLRDQTQFLSKVSFFQLQLIRWLCIVFVLAFSLGCYSLLAKESDLASIGQIAFAGIAQLSPAMTGALYWRMANRQGVLAGLFVGVVTWFCTLLFPLLLQEKLDSFKTIAFFEWLQQLLPFQLSYITLCTVLSLFVNFTVFIVVSFLSKKRVTEHWQATRFISQETGVEFGGFGLSVKLEDLLTLVSLFIGENKALDQFNSFAQKREITMDLSSKADEQWIAYTEHLLAKKLGASSARATVKSAIEGRDMRVDDVFLIVNEASEVLHFNRTLLQGALENLTQGISVVDKSLNLVAWNQRYLELFEYPEGFIQVGRPIADILYYNVRRGMCGEGNAKMLVEKRIKWLLKGNPHRSERLFSNGRVIEIIGSPMPGGGFVTSFTDITAFKQTEKALQEANEGLEQRVLERTRELSTLNQELIKAKGHAEYANESKSRFLAAVSHDLMQPLNAARLFSAALSQEALSTDTQELVSHLESSLHSAEELISDLLDISRLESGRITPKRQPVVLNNLLDLLRVECCALVPKGLSFKVHSSYVVVDTDPKLLRRILQNFLTNAFRYGKGRVVLGVRRLSGAVRIEVWDQGEGIAEDKQKVIFEEFKRLDNHQTRAEKGTGLGLAIADGFCKLLEHQLCVRSWLGKGSVFSVTVPLLDSYVVQARDNVEVVQAVNMDGIRAKGDEFSDHVDYVLCVDNEDSILVAMKTLLSRWGCHVLLAKTQADCQQFLAEGFIPKLALVDYHLDNAYTGLELVGWLREQLGTPVPAIIISADSHVELVERIQSLQLGYVKKPVKPAQLRALMSQYLRLK